MAQYPCLDFGVQRDPPSVDVGVHGPSWQEVTNDCTADNYNAPVSRALVRRRMEELRFMSAGAKRSLEESRPL